MCLKKSNKLSFDFTVIQQLELGMYVQIFVSMNIHLSGY